jgi:hypothetical protein
MGYVCLHSLAVPEKPSIITVHQHKSSTPRSGMMGSRGAAMPAKGLEIGTALEEYRYRLYSHHPVIDLFIL